MDILSKAEQELLERNLARRELMLKLLFKGDDTEMSPDVKNMRVAKEIIESIDAMVLKQAEIKARANADDKMDSYRQNTLDFIKQSANGNLPIRGDNVSTSLPDTIKHDIKPAEYQDFQGTLELKDFVKDNNESD